MGIFKRVGDIVSANLNDMIERFESPETMLRQAIREMDAAIAKQMESAAGMIADERMIGNELARLHQITADLQTRARQAVARGDDAAARRCLSQRQEQQRLIAALEDQLVTARSTGEQLRRQLDAMRIRRREAEHSWRLLMARNRSATARRQMSGGLQDSPVDAAGFARFDRLREKVERHEAETDAFLELNATADAIGSPPDDFDPTAAADVEAQLLELKQQRV